MLNLQKQNTANLKKSLWLVEHSGLLVKKETCCFFQITTIQYYTSALIKDSSNQPLWLLKLLINQEEDTDVIIDNDVNDNSLQVSFDDDDVNNSSNQVSCDEEARDNSSFNISFEEMDQGTTQSDFRSWSPSTLISWQLKHLFSVGISWQLPQERHSRFPRCEHVDVSPWIASWVSS